MAHKSLILDRYRVIEVAGSGGYATVYHAYDTHLKRDVAIKSMELSAADIERAQMLADKARQRQQRAMQAATAAHAATAAAAGHASPPTEADALTPGSKISFAEWAGGSNEQALRAAGFPDEPAFLDALEASRGRQSPRLNRRHQGEVAQAATLTSPFDPATAPAAAPAAAQEAPSGLPMPFIPTPDQIAAALGTEGVNVGAPLPSTPLTGPLTAPFANLASSAAPMAAGAPLPSTASGAPHLTTQFAPSALAQPLPALGVAPEPEPAPEPMITDLPPSSLTQSFTSAASDLAGTDPFAHIPGLNEARTIAQLNDANIVTVYDCELHGRTVYIIMEYIEGKTLANIMNEVGDDIDLDIIAAVFTSVAHALEVAHDADVLHLDVKPENVVVNSKGVVKVTDFGLATLLDASGKGTAGGGTIGYMPLEQMRQEALDARTDEWALASLTYEMLSGVNPFFADDLASAERIIEEAELVVPSMCWDILDPAVDDVIFAALDGDVAERYPSVAEFAEELAPYLGNARKGERELAAIVKGPKPAPSLEAAPAQPAARPARPKGPRKPRVPLVDRFGERGGAWMLRGIALLASLLVTAVALVNLRFEPSAVYGLFTNAMPVFWAVLAAVGACAALWPALGGLVALGAFVLMLLFNGAYLVGGAVALVVGAWWWLIGRRGAEPMSALLLQPLLGAFGFGAMAPVSAGMLLSVVEAAATALTAGTVSFAFAALGSGDLMNWAIWANAITAANPVISSASINTTALAMLASPAFWCVLGSWVLAAGAFALGCVRGTRSFDVVGAVAATAVLVAGAVAGGLMVVPGAPMALNPLDVLFAALPGLAGIVCAAIGVPDRARTED